MFLQLCDFKTDTKIKNKYNFNKSTELRDWDDCIYIIWQDTALSFNNFKISHFQNLVVSSFQYSNFFQLLFSQNSPA